MRYFFYYIKEDNKHRMIGAEVVDPPIWSVIKKLKKDGIIVEEVSFKKWEMRDIIADESWR